MRIPTRLPCGNHASAFVARADFGLPVIRIRARLRTAPDNHHSKGVHMKNLQRLGAVLAIGLVGVALAATAAARPQAEPGTIVDVAAGNKSFSTLVTLVKAGGLVKALSGDAKLTVFAPTNAAFASLEKEV